MRRIAAIAAIAMLAACGSEQSGTVETADGDVEYTVDQEGDAAQITMTGPDGQEINIDSGSGAAADLPFGFAVYPGAEVASSTSVSQDGENGAMVAMQSDASPAEMIAFYRSQAEAAGFSIETVVTNNAMQMIGGEAADGSGFSFTATPAEGGTSGLLTIAQKTQ